MDKPNELLGMFNHKPQVLRLVFAGWVLVLAICVWWLPETSSIQQYDIQFSIYLAKSLAHHPAWAQAIGFFNTPSESYFNVFIMLACQLLWCFHLSEEQKSHCYYQIAVCFITVSAWIHWVIKPFASLPKVSPVLMVPSVHQTIAHLYGPEGIIGSQHCFASGHAFAMFYSLFYFIHDKGNKRLKLFIALVACVFSLNRVIIGEHWFSDFSCSVLLAYVCVQIVQVTNIESMMISLIRDFSDWCRQKRVQSQA